MMKKVLVTGANGLLGEACCRLLKNDSRYSVIPMTRKDVDLANLPNLRECLDRVEFDVLINTAAMSGLEQCLDNPVLASRVNTDAPEAMAEMSRDRGAKMIQISTDYVLDGREELVHSDGTRSMAITRASGVYSTTKLEAEAAVLQADARHVVARVSWLFGHGRESFVDKVLLTARAEQQGCYVMDKFSVPNFCDDLVPVIAHILECDVGGVLHLTNDAEPESWFTYAKKVLEIAKDLGVLGNKKIRLKPQMLKEISFFKEDRPRYTVMRPQRLSEECHLVVRNWEDGVRVYLAQKYGNSLTC